ncbi:plasma membrane iron permease [Verticillium alfalfae VaMs.102]|uniref:Plasma membrane iron permease n=1 Tax=Verticillium alfalfae (strain VaMs.102 / ATCC MYA-4576 / FGSC 10136) TaxID=526221 RepID=C9SW03_VERA1|nr:plasma membrane iron permease [Verticillium alfalfae VaMs.102]EEY22968.1 plasma membrane iron permease [Verticillium alfalfae VaMs.102]
MEDLFSLPIFFITFRESLETAIIVSVLLAFIKRTLDPQRDAVLYSTMVRQVWLGTAVGVLVCILLGAVLIGGVYGLAADEMGGAEDIWEGLFSLGASLVITLMGAVLLRVTKLQDKWHAKLSKALSSTNDDNGRHGTFMDRFRFLSEKYALFILPFITVLREGFEGVLFIAGVGIGLPVTSIPLSVLSGLLVGAVVGLIIYKGSNVAPIQYFLVFSTCFLYLVAAGLFSKGVWHLEAHQWNLIVGGDAPQAGFGAGFVRHSPQRLARQLLQPRPQRRRRLGHLQRRTRLAKLGYRRLRRLVQPLLDRRRPGLRCHGLPRTGALALPQGRRRQRGAAPAEADREPLLAGGARSAGDLEMLLWGLGRKAKRP